MRNAVRPLAIALVRVRTLLPALIWILAILSASTALAKETRLVVELTTPENGAAYMAPAIISLEATVKLIDQNEKDKDKVKGKERYKKKSNDNKKDKGDSKSRQGQEEQEHGNPHRRVVKVEFLQGANVIGTAMVAPYVFDWGAVPAGKYVLSARAITAKGKTVEAAPVEISVGTNVAPTVMLTAPALNTVVTAPANITVSADAADSDGSVTQVEFFADGNVIGTATTIPFTIQWANVTSGSYSLTARATDNANAQTTSAPVNITVNQVAQVYYIHPDHLNTPRAITNQTGQLVWAWTNDDPFGANVPNENPSGLGDFNCNLRLPGQYFDQETNLHYNYFRDYDPAVGRYVEADLLDTVTTYSREFTTGINHLYLYVEGNPVAFRDSLGLLVMTGPRPTGPRLVAQSNAPQQPRFPGSSCGPEGSRKNFPSEFRAWSFQKPCQNHDICYSRCGTPKAVCDRQFYDDMIDQCSRIPPATGLGFARVLCRDVGHDYFIAVVLGGSGAYNRAQAICKGC